MKVIASTNFKFKFLLVLFSLFVTVSAVADSALNVSAKTKDLKVLKLGDIAISEFNENQVAATKETVTRFLSSHYKKINLEDPVVVEDIFNRFIDFIDRSHDVFLDRDIKLFKAKYAENFGEYLYSGDLSAIYNIYSLALKRFYQRYSFVLTLLDKEPDLSGNQQLLRDRSKAPFLTSSSDLDDLWAKKVKNEVLTQKLKGSDWNKVQKKLKRRYTFAIKRLSQIKSDDVLQIFLNSFGGEFDPHTNYLSPRNTEKFQEDMSLSLVGIGATLRIEDETTTIVSLIAGAPAEKSKQLKAGDKIIGVGQKRDDIEDVVGLDIEDVVDKIKGKKGTAVYLEIEPANGGKIKLVKIIRDRIDIEQGRAKVSYKKEAKHNIATITIPSFYFGLTEDVSKLLTEISAKKNVAALIIDLRNNGGGSLEEAIGLSSLFIADGPVVQVRDSYNRVEVYTDDGSSQVYKKPLFIMINRFSASASEIFAAAMQDYNRAIILGNQSFGKGTVQQSRLLQLQSFFNATTLIGSVRYTIQKFYRINGESTQLKGVMPDISFPNLIDPTKYGEEQEDNALDWDKITSSSFVKLNSLDDIIKTLDDKHKHRIAKNREFVRQAERDELVKANNDDYISLNYAKRKKLYDNLQEFDLKTINSRFLAEGKKEIKNLDDLPKDYEAPDYYLEEARLIVVDFLNLD